MGSEMCIRDSGEAVHGTRGEVRGNGVAYWEGHQERAGQREEALRWKRATARLEETGDNAEERDRLVRVVSNVGGEILQRE